MKVALRPPSRVKSGPYARRPPAVANSRNIERPTGRTVLEARPSWDNVARFAPRPLGRREPKQGGEPVAESVYKVIELVGTSTDSWEKAASAAVERAAETLRDLRVAEVVEQDIAIKDGKVEAYRVKMRLSFKYEKADD
jgi:hypothetical protein